MLVKLLDGGASSAKIKGNHKRGSDAEYNKRPEARENPDCRE